MTLVIASFFMITALGVAAIIMLEREKTAEQQIRRNAGHPVRFDS